MLGAALLDRIETVRENGSAELGLRALRLAPDEDAPFSYEDEKYDRREGETVPLPGESEEDFEARESELPGATDIYDLEQVIDLDDGEAADNPYYTSRIVHFEDPDDAEAFFETVVDGFLDNPGPYQNAERLDDIPAVGDAADGFSYEFEVNENVNIAGNRIYALVGTDVVFVQVDAAEAPTGAVADLIEAQVTCLEDGGACEAVAIPDELLATRGLSSDDADTPVAEEETPATGLNDLDDPEPTSERDAEETPIDRETPEPNETREAAGGVDGNSYTSPNFGYTVSWDPDIWEVEDESSEDGHDQLRLGDPINTVYLSGVEGFGGDPAACLEGTSDALDDGEGVSNYRPAEDRNGNSIGAESQDRAFAQYELTLTNDDGDRVRITNYVECRVLVPDEAVLAIVYIVATDEFEAQFPLVEDLLDAIEIREAR